MPSIVFQHHANGTDYAYMSTSYWDKAKKASRTKMICIGKKDPDTGKIIYNRKWQELQNQKKNVLSESESLEVSSTISIGPSLLLETVTKRTGLRRSLLKGFDRQTVNRLLSLSWFFASSSYQRAYLAEGWMESHRCPEQETPLTSPRITELLQSITRDQIVSFFNSWIRRSTDAEHLCFDITSVSCHGTDSEYVEYGYNRDKEHLPQINIALLSGMDSEIPFYYEIIPGSLHDVSYLPTFIAMLKKLRLKKVSLMADKGFYSAKNLSLLIDEGIKFTMPVPKTIVKVKGYIDKDRDVLELPGNILIADESSTIYGKTHRSTLNGKRVYYHVYTDTARRIEHVAQFNAHILELSQELESGLLDTNHAEEYDTYFTIKDTPKRGRKVTWKLEEIKEHRDKYVGYWALVTSAEPDAKTALVQYRKRDRVEKQFDTLKHMLDGRRLRTKGPIAHESIVFIRFLSLIITEYVRKVLKDTPIKEKKESSKRWITRYTVAEVFNRLESYTEVSFKGRYKPIRPTKTKAQREIFKIFELDQ